MTIAITVYLQSLLLRPMLRQAHFDVKCGKRNFAALTTNGMVERFNGRIEDVLQSHHFRSGEELEATLYRSLALQQLPQSALASHEALVQAQT